MRLFPLLGLLLAAPLVKAEEPNARPAVAVLYFDYDGKDEELGALRKGLTQMLTTDLAASESLVVVERVRLEEVLSELTLGQSGKIDAKTAAKVGKLLGAKYLVMGRYFELKGALRLDARAIETETGQIIRSAGAHGPTANFFELEQKLASDLGEALAKVAPASPPNSRPATPSKVAKKVKVSTPLAVQFSKALDAIDHKKTDEAKTQLTSIIREQPDFELAKAELTALLR